jgi:hypothetical protein
MTRDFLPDLLFIDCDPIEQYLGFLLGSPLLDTMIGPSPDIRLFVLSKPPVSEESLVCIFAVKDSI